MSSFPSDTSRNSMALARNDPDDAFKKRLRAISEPAGRVILSLLFLVSGLGKIAAFSATVDYMAAMGVPGVLLPIAIVTEVVGAIAIVLGWQTRIFAFLLAGYCLLTAFVFHSNFDDPIEMVMFLKNFSIAGGLLLLVANGAGSFSFDRRAGR
jgi:putative oxidoreductase